MSGTGDSLAAGSTRDLVGAVGLPALVPDGPVFAATQPVMMAEAMAPVTSVLHAAKRIPPMA